MRQNSKLSPDEVAGDANVDDVDQDGDQGEDEGPGLQGDAAEKLLWVVELEAQLLPSSTHLDSFNLQPSSSTVNGLLICQHLIVSICFSHFSISILRLSVFLLKSLKYSVFSFLIKV